MVAARTSVVMLADLAAHLGQLHGQVHVKGMRLPLRFVCAIPAAVRAGPPHLLTRDQRLQNAGLLVFTETSHEAMRRTENAYRVAAPPEKRRRAASTASARCPTVPRSVATNAMGRADARWAAVDGESYSAASSVPITIRAISPRTITSPLRPT
jgi:hypothetical protein